MLTGNTTTCHVADHGSFLWNSISSIHPAVIWLTAFCLYGFVLSSHSERKWNLETRRKLYELKHRLETNGRHERMLALLLTFVLDGTNYVDDLARKYSSQGRTDSNGRKSSKDAGVQVESHDGDVQPPRCEKMDSETLQKIVRYLLAQEMSRHNAEQRKKQAHGGKFESEAERMLLLVSIGDQIEYADKLAAKLEQTYGGTEEYHAVKKGIEASSFFTKDKRRGTMFTSLFGA